MLLIVAVAATLLLASGVALAVTKTGGPGSDVLRGTGGRDYIKGKGGDDVIYGLGGNDNSPKLFTTGEIAGGLIGGFGDDIIYGGPGNDDMVGYEGFIFGSKDRGDDQIYGQQGRDRMDGGFGADILSGGDGPDFILDGENRRGSTDIIYGGDGDDELNAFNRPGGRDIVNCGDGKDVAIADRKDILNDCERVRFQPAPGIRASTSVRTGRGLRDPPSSWIPL